MNRLLNNRNLLAKSLETSFSIEGEFFILNINNKEIKFPKNNENYNKNNGIMSPEEWLINEHANNRVHEPGLVYWLLALSTFFDNKKIRFVDVGALYGYFSFIALSIFENSEIISIEANPRSAAYIKNVNNQFYDSRVYVKNCFVSDRLRDKQKRYVVGYHFIDENNYFEQLFWIKCKNQFKNILKNLGFSGFSIFHPELIEIDEIPLSSFLSIDPNVTNIIKIDAEGYQAVFLPAAAQQIIKTKSIILLEFDSTKDLEKFKSTNDNLCRPFIEKGYELYWCDHRIKSEPAVRISSVERSKERNSLGVLIHNSLIEE